MLVEIEVNMIKEVTALIYTGWISIIIFLFGGVDTLFISLICLMLIDFISGLFVAYKQKTLNSKKGCRGLKKKVMTLLLVCSVCLMDRLIPHMGLRPLVLIFYSSIELLSIIENAGKYGIPIPEKLKKALEQCQEQKTKESTKK